MQGITESGFEYNINDAVLRDWSFVKAMAEIKYLEESDSEEIDFINISAKLEKILFKDGGKAFEKHIASLNDGFVPTDVLIKELFEIIKSRPETKN